LYIVAIPLNAKNITHFFETNETIRFLKRTRLLRKKINISEIGFLNNFSLLNHKSFFSELKFPMSIVSIGNDKNFICHPSSKGSSVSEKKYFFLFFPHLIEAEQPKNCACLFLKKSPKKKKLFFSEFSAW